MLIALYASGNALIGLTGDESGFASRREDGDEKRSHLEKVVGQQS